MQTYIVTFYAYYSMLGLREGSTGGGEATIRVTVVAPNEQEAIHMGTKAIDTIKEHPKADWGPFKNIRHKSIQKADPSKPGVLGIIY